MPVIKSAYTRYRIIDHCLKNRQKRFPTLEKLAETCHDILGIEVSTSTIEKDITAMKQPYPRGFSAPIVYNKKEKGYTYAEAGFSISSINLENEEWEGLHYAAKLLNQYKEVPIFHNFKQAIEKLDTAFNLGLGINDPLTDKFVQFETGVSVNGYEWIASVYQALTNKFKIEISYENIYKNEVKAYVVIPYLLKEHRNRWYVTGWVEQRNDYLTFALDRIQSLAVIEQRQQLKNDFNPDRFLQHATGIMEGNGKPYKVVLSISEPFNKLVKLEPLHITQQIIKETTKSIRVEISVNINPEFCMQLLSMGPYCKILQPVSLKNQIKELLKQTLAQYE